MGAKQAKRIFSLFLALVLVFSLVPAAFADDPTTPPTDPPAEIPDDKYEFYISFNGADTAPIGKMVEWTAEVNASASAP